MEKRNTSSFNKMFFTLAIILLGNSILLAQASSEQQLTAIEDGVGFSLNWTAANDDDTALFVVERSEDGKEYKAIGSVEGQSSDGQTAYQFKDLDLGLSKVQYRLKQVKPDGSNSYTSPISSTKEFVCFFEITHKEMLTPEIAQVTINSAKKGVLNYQLSTNDGEKLMEETKSIEEGLNEYSVDLSNEPDGTYQIVFRQDNVSMVATIIKDKKGNMADKPSKKRGG
jgi:trimeric autotransporter adhesin